MSYYDIDTILMEEELVRAPPAPHGEYPAPGSGDLPRARVAKDDLDSPTAH